MELLERPPVLRSKCGTVVPLDVERWRSDVDDVEAALLDTLDAPALDVGCGPGRVVSALTARGRVALGIDTAPSAVAEARRRGVAVIERSVFDPLPGEGRWRSAVLLDGNIGIGGDPCALLSRLARVVAPGGQILAEVDPPAVPSSHLDVRLEAAGRTSGWFRWARLNASDAPDVLDGSGWTSVDVKWHGGRWYVTALRP